MTRLHPMLIDALAGEGLDRGWLTTAAGETPHALFARRSPE